MLTFLRSQLLLSFWLWKFVALLFEELENFLEQEFIYIAAPTFWVSVDCHDPDLTVTADSPRPWRYYGRDVTGCKWVHQPLLASLFLLNT